MLTSEEEALFFTLSTLRFTRDSHLDLILMILIFNQRNLMSKKSA